MSNPQERFTELWHVEAPHVLAFANRHVGAEAAHDVVAETFMIAWRRWGELAQREVVSICGSSYPRWENGSWPPKPSRDAVHLAGRTAEETRRGVAAS